MYKCYYLLVWCEDAGCWWQADECEERSLAAPMSCLRAATRDNVVRASRGPWWCRTN